LRNRSGLAGDRQHTSVWAIWLSFLFAAITATALASEFGLSDEYGGGQAFQAIELFAAGLPVGAGLVRYAPEFAAVG